MHVHVYMYTVHVSPSLCIPVFLSPLSPHVPPYLSYLCLYLPPTLPSSPPPTLQIQDSASRLLPLLHQPERCATDTHCPLHTGADQSAALLRPHWAGQCIHYITIHVYVYIIIHVHCTCICVLLYVCTLSVYVCVCCRCQVRSGCDFLCRVCQDEHQLYFHFFSVDSTELKSVAGPC